MQSLHSFCTSLFEGLWFVLAAQLVKSPPLLSMVLSARWSWCGIRPSVRFSFRILDQCWRVLEEPGLTPAYTQASTGGWKNQAGRFLLCIKLPLPDASVTVSQVRGCSALRPHCRFKWASCNSCGRHTTLASTSCSIFGTVCEHGLQVLCVPAFSLLLLKNL